MLKVTENEVFQDWSLEEKEGFQYLRLAVLTIFSHHGPIL